MKELNLNNEKVAITNLKFQGTEVSFEMNSIKYSFSVNELDKNHFKVVSNKKSYDFIKAQNLEFAEGVEFSFDEGQRSKNKKKSAMPGSMVSPMPGKILKIFVNLGDTVEVGEPLLVMEAMKMEHTIKAGSPGVVEHIYFKVGDQIQASVDLVKIKLG